MKAELIRYVVHGKVPSVQQYQTDLYSLMPTAR